MRIILADPPIRGGFRLANHPNLGILYLSSYLKKIFPNIEIMYLEQRLNLQQHLQKAKEFNPQFLIIAIGFDTHKDDPIGGFCLTTKIYSQIGKKLALLNIPTLICQEGGYKIKILGNCVQEFLEGFSFMLP